MDIPDNICECLRQFLQAQAANFNSIMENVRDQRVVAGNGVVPSHALIRPGIGAGVDNSQLLTVLILVLFVAFLFGIGKRTTSKRVGVEKGARPPPSSPPDSGGGDLIR